MKKLKMISMTLILTLSIICLSPVVKPVSAVVIQPMYVVVCNVHGASHATSTKIATQAVVTETGKWLALTRAKCECGTYLWYEGYPSWGITTYFYGDPNFMQCYRDSLNRTVFKISSSKLYYGNPPNWIH
jgi:hypothetical protein